MQRFLKNIALYMFHIGFARPVLRWVVGLRYRGKSRVPAGPCLVVSNHNSHLDAPILATMFPLKRLPGVHPVAAADYFGSTWIKRMFAMLFMNAMAIERHPPKGTDPLSPLVAGLAAGKSLIFFPEGSRGEAGVVAPFRAGIGRLVKQVPGLLVLPVFLSGPERIWARGQVVPVPLNIDAIVGKPRTYSPELDAREIAEQVRRDVLALAPPAPPQPGPPPRPPARISICGVDGQKQRELFRRVVELVSAAGRTLGIADPIIEADSDGVREVTGPIPFARGRAWLSPLAWAFRTGGKFKGDRFVEMVERARLNEALGQGRDARFVVTDGSALVDLMAWAEAEFYRGVFDESGLNHMMQYLAGQKKIPVGNWWRFIRKAPEVWLINTFGLARPPVPEILVIVSLPVARTMERLRSRGKQLESYENEEFLTKLQTAYNRVGGVLNRRRKVVLMEVDPTESDLDSIAGEIVAAAIELQRLPEAEEG